MRPRGAEPRHGGQPPRRPRRGPRAVFPLAHRLPGAPATSTGARSPITISAPSASTSVASRTADGYLRSCLLALQQVDDIHLRGLATLNRAEALLALGRTARGPRRRRDRGEPVRGDPRAARAGGRVPGARDRAPSRGAAPPRGGQVAARHRGRRRGALRTHRGRGLTGARRRAGAAGAGGRGAADDGERGPGARPTQARRHVARPDPGWRVPCRRARPGRAARRAGPGGAVTRGARGAGRGRPGAGAGVRRRRPGEGAAGRLPARASRGAARRGIGWNVRPAVRYHRERRDGSGPAGLRGDAIPIDAEIVGIVDAHDHGEVEPAAAAAWWRPEILSAFRRAPAAGG